MQDNKFYQYRLFAICFAAVTFGALDSVLSSAYLPDIIRDLSENASVAEAGEIGAWINFAFLAGGAIGGISLGFLSDRIGRKRVLMIALLSYSVGSGLGALTGSWEMLTMTRLLVGIGVGASLVLSAVIISEAWPEAQRAVALGILSVAYPVGIVLSGAITSSVKDWRTAFFIGASAMLLVFGVWRWIQESVPAKEKISRAPETLSGIRSKLISGILLYGSMLIGLWAAFSWLPTWVQSLVGTDSPEGQSLRGLSMALLGGGGLLGGIVSGFLSKRFGSRTVQAACFISCILLSYFLFQMQEVYSPQVTLGVGLLGICFGISQGALNEYIPILFPAALRSTATGLCFHIGRIFTAVAVFFVGAFVVWFGGYGNAIFAFSTVYIVGLIALYFIPDVNTHPVQMPEVLDSERF